MCLRESVSKLVCDWEGLGGLGGEEVQDDSIKRRKKEKILRARRIRNNIEIFSNYPTTLTQSRKKKSLLFFITHFIMY
jgi:hypothetical protein